MIHFFSEKFTGDSFSFLLKLLLENELKAQPDLFFLLHLSIIFRLVFGTKWIIENSAKRNNFGTISVHFG